MSLWLLWNSLTLRIWSFTSLENFPIAAGNFAENFIIGHFSNWRPRDHSFFYLCFFRQLLTFNWLFWSRLGTESTGRFLFQETWTYFPVFLTFSVPVGVHLLGGFTLHLFHFLLMSVLLENEIQFMLESLVNFCVVEICQLLDGTAEGLLDFLFVLAVKKNPSFDFLLLLLRHHCCLLRRLKSEETCPRRDRHFGRQVSIPFPIWHIVELFLECERTTFYAG